MKKIKRGDLLPWFLEDHGNLPAWYLMDCEKIFNDIDKELVKATKERNKKNEQQA